MKRGDFKTYFSPFQVHFTWFSFALQSPYGDIDAKKKVTRKFLKYVNDFFLEVQDETDSDKLKLCNNYLSPLNVISPIQTKI